MYILKPKIKIQQFVTTLHSLMFKLLSLRQEINYLHEGFFLNLIFVSAP